MTTVPTFAVHNDTPWWAIILDGRLGLYATQAEADAVWAEIHRGRGMIEDLPFGSVQMLAPGYRCERCHHASHGRISDHVIDAVDLRPYIADAWAPKTVPERVYTDAEEAEFKALFDRP